MTKELSGYLKWPPKRTWRWVKYKRRTIETEHSYLLGWLNFHCAVQSNLSDKSRMVTVLVSESEHNDMKIALLNRDKSVLLTASAVSLEKRVFDIENYFPQDRERNQMLNSLLDAAFNKINTLNTMAYLENEISEIEPRELVLNSL